MAKVPNWSSNLDSAPEAEKEKQKKMKRRTTP